MSINTTRRLLPRFSLRVLLLLMIIAALAVAQWSATREVHALKEDKRKLESEIEKLRVETGYLEVKDPTKFAVLNLPTLEQLTWRWKVHVPAGKWVMKAGVGEVPSIGTELESAQISSFPVDSKTGRELRVEAVIRRSASGDWQAVVQCDKFLQGPHLQADSHLIPPGSSTTLIESREVGTSGVEVFPAEKPPELWRYRVYKDGNLGGVHSNEPVPGLLIWFERQHETAQQ